MKKYTIKSTSAEGVFYLVNGWRKCKTFWFDEKSVLGNPDWAVRYFFTKASQAKASMTRLLKVMPEYGNDLLEIVSFEEA